MPANGVRTGHNRRFGDTVILDERTLQLKRAEAIIGAFEDVVCSTNIGKITLGIAASHIAGAVVTSGKAFCGARFIIYIAVHQTLGLGIALHRNLAVIAFLALAIKQNYAVTRRGFAHGARLYRLSWEIAQQKNILGLAKSVADCDIPGRSDLLDNLWVERFSSTRQLFKLHRE